LYEEINSSKANEAEAMILKCEEEMKKTETATPTPATQTPQKATGIQVLFFIIAVIALLRRT